MSSTTSRTGPSSLHEFHSLQMDFGAGDSLSDLGHRDPHPPTDSTNRGMMITPELAKKVAGAVGAEGSLGLHDAVAFMPPGSFWRKKGSPARCPFSPNFFGGTPFSVGRVPLLKLTTETMRYTHGLIYIYIFAGRKSTRSWVS